MRAIRTFWTPLFCLLLLVPAIVVAGPPVEGQAAATTNVLTLDLGTLGGVDSFARDITSSGIVVGESNLAGGGAHAFSHDLLAGGPMVDLGSLPGEVDSKALGITDSGVVIGSTTSYGFTYDTAAAAPQMTALPFPDGVSTNAWMTTDVFHDSGTIAGWWGDDNDDPVDYRAYAYDPDTGSSTNLGGFGDDWGFLDINANTAVGFRWVGDVPDGFVQALDASTDRVDLNTRFGWDWSLANGIADDGLVVGEYCDDTLNPDTNCSNDEWTGFAWAQGTTEPIDLPRRDAGVHANPRFINDDWIIADETFPNPNNVVAYSRQDLSQPPVLLGGLRSSASISEGGVVVGQTYDWQIAGLYDLATSSEAIALPPLGGVTSRAYAAEHVGGHIIAVGYTTTASGAFHAAAWVLGVPDAPTIGLVTDTDGIAPVDGLTADETPTLAGTTLPSGPVVVRDSEGTLLATVTADATGAWSYTSPARADGTYEFTATYEPTSGWPSNPAAITVTVETIPPPTVTIGTPKVTGSTVTVPFTIDGTYDPATLTCQLDDTTPVPCASTTEHVFTKVVQGDHVATIEAATSAGAAGQGNATFTVKAATYTEPEPPPTVLTVAINDVTAAKNGPITATFEAQAGTDPYTFTCTLVGGTTNVTETCTSPWTYPGDGSWLAGGKYELTVTATDSADPAGTATATTTVNVPGPKT